MQVCNYFCSNLIYTWVWVNSGNWWWTGRPGVLRFMGSQRVGHDWATELNWIYTYTCVYTYIYTQIHSYTHRHTCTHINIYPYTYTCIYTHIYFLCTYINIYACTHMSPSFLSILFVTKSLHVQWCSAHSSCSINIYGMKGWLLRATCY